MKIGIIVHSQTGNTFHVGQKIFERLQNEGHEVSLVRFQNVADTNGKSKTMPLQLDSIPDVVGFDAVILGGWVEAFSLCPGFKQYLQQLNQIESKIILCLLTQHFPHKWMGGSHALAQARKVLASKGCNMVNLGVINWTNKKREAQIEASVSKASDYFGRNK